MMMQLIRTILKSRSYFAVRTYPSLSSDQSNQI